MNKHDLFDALTGIDDDLLERSEHKVRRRFSPRKLLIAAAAVMLLAMTAFAAPILAEFFFDSNVERTIFGTTLTTLDGSEITYNSVHMIHFDVENPEELPTTIEEYCIPHYVEENGWTLDGGYLYTYNFGERTNIRWVNEGVPYQWIEFEQASFYQFAEEIEQAPGTNQFGIYSAPGTELTQQTLSTSLGEIPVYLATNLPYAVQDYDGNREMHIFWSNGTYAFHIMTSDAMDPEMLAQIIESVAVVNDPTPYLVDNGRTGPYLIAPALENQMTLTAVPEGFTLTQCDAKETSAYWQWDHSSGDYVGFLQDTKDSLDLKIHLYTLEQREHTLSEMNLNGSTVYFITAEDHVRVLWKGTDCEYDLIWATENPVNWEQVAELIRSLEPVEDISAYTTD